MYEANGKIEGGNLYLPEGGYYIITQSQSKYEYLCKVLEILEMEKELKRIDAIVEDYGDKRHEVDKNKIEGVGELKNMREAVAIEMVANE